MKDGKMSKSVGNVIYPEALIDRYGLDATKYYLLRLMSFEQDATFTPEDFVEKYNSDLANDLGNLLNRTIGMINKYCDGIIPVNITEKTDFDDILNEFAQNQISKIEKEMDSYHISNAIQEAWKYISRVNKYIDETAPWVLAKEPENKEKLNSVMFNLAEALRKIAIIVSPYIRNTSEQILKQLGIELDNLNWDKINESNAIKENTKVVEKAEPIFMRLDKEEEIEYIKSLMNHK